MDKEEFEKVKKDIQQAAKEGKVELAPQIESESHQDVAEHFFPKILEMEANEVLWTDESSLGDFITYTDEHEKEKKEVVAKVQEIYGVDVSDMVYGPLTEVFKLISHTGTGL